MFFKRINDNTINCIITPEDLSERGIHLEDLFERKQEAMNYLRSVILQAASEENFSLEGDYTSMRISVLPDHSISLTLTEGAPAMMQGQAGKPGAGGFSQGKTGQAPAATKAGNGSDDKPEEKKRQAEYAYVFYSMNDVIEGCRNIAAADCYTSSLYEDRKIGEFYLILKRKGEDQDAEFEKIVLSMNEFGDALDEGPEYLAYIKEHRACLLKGNAAQQLAAISD
ncbi:Negative regulator of genetic competence, sporulation and motility [Lachnospiraceae bacterium NK3A20]|jgi:negative regulator of genetic competence, sporulation and motility|nr:Negative regulator of genetic competence, sporulation and motility [Lachnospiraceae bacterium NK3A20]